MFAALSVDENDRRMLKGFPLLMPLRGHATERILLDSKYRLITATQRGGRVGWRDVKRLAGELSGKMILPEGLKPPGYIGVFEPSRFESLLVANTAVELLRQSKLQMYRRVVGLVDMRGDFEELAVRLLPFCLSVKVLTQRQHKYDAFAARVLELYGVPLMVGPDYDMLADCALVIDPGAVLEEHLGVYTITASERTGEGVISHLCAGLPDHDEHAGISCHLLAAALYELSGSRAAGALWASTMRLSGRKISFDELCGEFARASGKIVL